MLRVRFQLKVIKKCYSLFLSVTLFVFIFLAYPRATDDELPLGHAVDGSGGDATADTRADDYRTNRTAAPGCPRKNVLFLVSDDLRPQLGSYSGRDYPNPMSDQVVLTPNLDALARRSLVLLRAYAQWSSCGPSRSSFLTSRRPHTTKVWDLHSSWRTSGGNFTSLPQLFKENGYLTAGAGKVFHPSETDANDPASWSLPFYEPANLPYWSRVSTVGVSWKAVTKAERLQLPLEDEQTTDYAQKLLRVLAPRAKSCRQPFFLAAGFHKPHLPFVFPEEFLKLYPLSEVRPPLNPYAPIGMPEVAWDDFIELRRYLDVRKLRNNGLVNETFPSQITRQLRRAYYATVSYVDFLVGRLLDELKSLELDDSTIVVFVSDHGFSLGENGEWGKHTNFEQSLHVPMMVHIPGLTDSGIWSRSLVELVDLYPTLAEASGLDAVLPCPEISANCTLCTEGASLIPLIERPSADIKDAAFSQHKRNNLRMGYSIRTDRYRYTEWIQIARTWSSYERWDFHNNWDNLLGAELYDHGTDPLETINLAHHRDHGNIRDALSRRLHRHFRSTILDFPRNAKSLFLDY
ncbi:hypothetical protein LSH36_387g01058 [Paralvinella palmiformis]|uniref:Sulfatase N-terminal domain-containing protein n=1 Tax=Paralvinella palmiformis TaxID=53620 RepID=A0AAD9JCT1_9ANNE|nr:hypothetical protein LSH36_387g01058 [Paralvinella palmiformis]